MSALLESLLDATRRADCAANDLEFGCSRTSTPLQEQMREDISTSIIPAASDDGRVGTGVINPEKRACTEANTAN
jgi:hypothetical protein